MAFLEEDIMNTKNTNKNKNRAPYPCTVIERLSGASVCWWGTSPRGYWLWSRACGREFIPLQDAGDRAMLGVWLELRRAGEARARSPSGVSA